MTAIIGASSDHCLVAPPTFVSANEAAHLELRSDDSGN
jgi:hypothetical protein